MIDEYGNNVFLINKLTVPSAVTINEDGSFTIFINAQLSHEKQKKCYLHELHHILNNDFERYDVQEIECFAHKKATV